MRIPRHPEHPDRSRRHFLTTIAVALPAALLLPGTVQAAPAGRARSLRFYHTHTGEHLRVEYHDGSDYVTDALAEIDQYLRDFRTDEIHPIDRGTLDILHALNRKTGNMGNFEIISAYRSPKTNAMLRSGSKGVAKRSLHMQGKALDIRLPGTDTRKLRDAAKSLKLGGVGYYAKSDFIHVDTGRVRAW